MIKVGFVGLGNMGGPMALNLANAGYQVTAFDISDTLLAQYAEQGVGTATSLASVARDAQVVITMLPAGKHVQTVYLGDDGLLANMAIGALAIDCSTIDGESVALVGAAAQARQIGFIDAPVSGGVVGAQVGTLAFMCGGTQANYDRALPLLQVMGAKQFLAGNLGAGQVAKVCNNQLLAVLMSATAEAIEMGVRSGLDAAVLSDIMQASSGNNWALQQYNPYPGVQKNSPASNHYKPGFMAQLMQKDLGLALTQAGSVGAVTPMGDQARILFQNLIDQQRGEDDFSAVMAHFTDYKK